MVGPRGMVVGIDILPLKIALPGQCRFIEGDINDEGSAREVEQAAGGKADAVLSDMSPNLSGVAFADAYKSYELALAALDFARRILRPGGSFVVKIFPGDEFGEFLAQLKGAFEEVHTVVPDATRKTSSERYLVAMGFKAEK